MKLIIYLTSILAGTIFAFPGMNNLMKELAKRQASGVPAPEMIGDLVQGATTLVGNQVKNCLLGTGTCQDLTPKVYPLSQYNEFNPTDNFLDVQSSCPAQSLLPSGYLLRLGLHLEGSCTNVHQF
jgi:hypothetical protein